MKGGLTLHSCGQGALPIWTENFGGNTKTKEKKQKNRNLATKNVEVV